MSTLNGTAMQQHQLEHLHPEHGSYTTLCTVHTATFTFPEWIYSSCTLQEEVCMHTTQPLHCQSVLCGYLQQSSEWILATNCHSSCSQAWELCHYSTSNSISQLDTLWNNMLNLAAISLGMSITLKYGASCITYKKALSVILINWHFGVL